MAFVPITNACSVELRFTQLGQRAALTLGFHKGTGISAADAIVIADHIANWWVAAGRVQMRNTVVLRETYVRVLDSESSPSHTSIVGAGTTGALGAGILMPFNTAFCISFRTALRGRANRGRNYYFGLTSSQISNGNEIAPSVITAVTGAYARLLPGGLSDPTPFRWVVLSRQLNGVTVGRAVPITTVVATDNIADSMRRRLPGRGL